jgi:EmrB/QacA subfamily drug resistance transporter
MPTSPITQETRQLSGRRAALRDRRGLALAIVLGAQLMIILDMTVVNIALPAIARGLHFSVPGLSWVLNAYTLTFGGLLLLGGRAGDILGRRRVFGAGIALFTVASLAGGLAQSAGWLLAARAAQGAGGAIASPAVLAMITAGFADGRERARALGIYTAVVMGGGSLGLVLGGVITEWVSWRWVLFINVPIGVLVGLTAPVFLPETARQPGHFDVTGALASTAGMVSLVYGIIRAAADGWGNGVALSALAAAAVLLAGFLYHESRARQPITPLRLFADRRRAGSYLTRLLIVAGMFGMFFFLTQFVQEILGFSPLRAGISFLPMTAALFGVSRLSPRLVSRFRPWILMVTGMLPVVAGMAWLSRISAGTGYLAGVLGPMVLIGAGMGVVFVPLTMASLSGVRPEDSGAASSMVNVMQQVGGSLGLAILVSAAGRPAAGHAAVVHGMSSAFTLAAVLDVLAFLVILTVMRARPGGIGNTATNE